jgi:hypothetical protein
MRFVETSYFSSAMIILQTTQSDFGHVINTSSTNRSDSSFCLVEGAPSLFARVEDILHVNETYTVRN